VAGKWWWGDANIMKACDPEHFILDVMLAEKFVSEFVVHITAFDNFRDGKLLVVLFSGVLDAVRNCFWIARAPPFTE